MKIIYWRGCKMDKEALIGLGLIGVAFASVGALIGGAIVRRNDNKAEELRVSGWDKIANTYRELLTNSYAENKILKNELKSKGEA
jgi:3-hydroxyacyl-CoA dehydrogenase